MSVLATLFGGVLFRGVWYKLIRGALAVVVSGAMAKMQGDPKYLWLVPIIQMVGKALRVQFPKAEKWIVI